MHKKLLILISCITMLSMLLNSCGKEEAKPVRLSIFSGQSLKNALEEIKEVYPQEKPNVIINSTYGSSGDNEKAIKQGVPADIFITGSSKIMDDLQSQGFLLPDTSKKFLSNKIVLIVSKDATDIYSFKDLNTSKVKKVILSDPNSGTSGKYAEEVLKYFKISAPLKPKFVFTKSGDSTVSLVENGKANAGIVFATDAIASNNVKIVAIAPENSHSPSIYNVAVLKTSKNIPEAKEFVQFLLNERASSVFVKYGFAISNNEQAN
jgi:molybdate transport system substrate-binding protein